MKKHFETEIKNMYVFYIENLKPLIAEIEARTEQFPVQILNEIRSYNDHLSRVFLNDDNDDLVERELKKAYSHLKRSMLDCYKILMIYLHDEFNKFDKRTKNIDLSLVNNGEFYIEYKRLRISIIDKYKTAKTKETEELPDDDKYSFFQNAYIEALELEKLIDSNFANIQWTRGKKVVKTILNGVLWLLSVVISGIISSYFFASKFDLFIKYLENFLKE